MTSLSENVKWFYQVLASKKLAIGLWLLLCIVLIPGTLTESTDYSLGIVQLVVLMLTGLNLIVCTVQRIKVLSRPVLIMHIGVILVLSGGMISSFGFVATANIYEGTTVNTVYRWDLKKDMPLGVDLTVKKINLEYYPVMVRIGVLKGEEKIGLFELKTGGNFQVAPYTIRADSLDFPIMVRLSVFHADRLIGTADTEGGKDLPEDFPYDFKLVAYQDPHPKMGGLDLHISKDRQVLADGVSRVNSPLTWDNLSFHHVDTNVDKYGQRYAGIQITKDPGRPYVYSGFGVIGISSVMYLSRMLRKVRA